MSTRKVEVSGMISAMDHETFGSNERESAPVSGVALVSSEGLPSELVKMSLGVGGEVRVDLELNVSISANDFVRINGSAKLFEGDDENTQDLEDEELVNIQVAPDHPRELKIDLANTGFGGGDTANIVLTFTNVEVPIGTVGAPLTQGHGSTNLTVSAVWQPDSGGEIQLYDVPYTDYRKKYDELWNQGWRLHLLENRVVNNQVRYTAVWRPSTSGEIQVYEWAYADYRKKYDELWNQGWRLHILNNVVVNEQVRYTAVWRPGTAGEIQVYQWPYADYRKKYDELWQQGWRLKLINTY